MSGAAPKTQTKPERHVRPPAQPDDPRYSITLPCAMWRGFLEACQSHLAGNAILSKRFAKVPKAIEILEQHTEGVDLKQDVTIEGYSSTFSMLAELALLENLAIKEGRELVIKASEAEFRKHN